MKKDLKENVGYQEFWELSPIFIECYRLFNKLAYLTLIARGSTLVVKI